MTASRAADGGRRVVVRFDQRTTDLDAIERAAYCLAKLMTIDIRVEGDDFACRILSLEGLDDIAAESRLRREVIDQTLRVRIGRDTEQVRNLIFAVAFSQTGLIDDDQSESDK